MTKIFKNTVIVLGLLASSAFAGSVGAPTNATVTASGSGILAGANESISGENSAILAGSGVQISSPSSVAAGTNARGSAVGTFTWGDSNIQPWVNFINNLPNHTWFKSAGGFSITISTNMRDGGFFVRGSSVGINVVNPQASLDLGSGTIRLGGVTISSWPSTGGDVYLASTQTFTGQNTFANDIIVSSGITLGGVFKSSWPTSGSGGDTYLASTQTFTGQNTFTQPIAGSITGNAGTVTNGVYTNDSYANPSWITDLATSKIDLSTVTAAINAKGDAFLSSTQTFSGTNTFTNFIYISSGIQSTGGNYRGPYAIDLQMYRSDASHVAAAPASFIAGGSDNATVDNAFASAVIGGEQNTAAGSGGDNAIIGGVRNTVYGAYGVIAGGVDQVLNSPTSFIGGGHANTIGISSYTAGAVGSAIIGGAFNRVWGTDSIITAGRFNLASGYASFAAGGYSSSTADGSFTWSSALNSGVLPSAINNVPGRAWFRVDGGFLVTSSTRPTDGGFYVSPAGQIGISTMSPQSALDVGSGGITLGGITKTAWPSGGDVILAASQTFTGTNIFTNQIIASTGITLGGVFHSTWPITGLQTTDTTTITGTWTFYNTINSTVTYANISGFSGTSGYSTNAGTATYSVTAGTSAYAITSGTGTYSITSGTSAFSNTAGNSATVNNGVYTTGAYSDPAWITKIATSKIDLSTITTAFNNVANATTTLHTEQVITSRIDLSTVTTAINARGDVFKASTQTFTGTNIFSNQIIASTGITLGGIFRSSWPSNGGDVFLASTQTFTGGNTFTQTINGSISGNAGTVTNGIYTSGSYANPSWITSLATSKVDLSTVTTAFNNVASATTSLHSEQVSISRIDLSTVTTAINARGDAFLAATQTFSGVNTFSQPIVGSANQNVLKSGDNMTGQLTTSSSITVQGNAFSVGGSTFVVTGGKVGIGTQWPSVTPDNPGGSLRVYSSTASAPSAWSGRIVAGGPANSVVMGELNGVATIGGHNAALSSWSNLSIPAGKLGIGTIAPSATLDVNGTIHSAAGIVGNQTGTQYGTGAVGEYVNQADYFTNWLSTSIASGIVYRTMRTNNSTDMTLTLSSGIWNVFFTASFWNQNGAVAIDTLGIGISTDSSFTTFSDMVETGGSGSNMMYVPCYDLTAARGGTAGATYSRIFALSASTTLYPKLRYKSTSGITIAIRGQMYAVRIQ